METSYTLGKLVHKHLLKLGIETPYVGSTGDAGIREIEKGFLHILGHLGMDLNDDSLRDTPKRITQMYTREIFYGLDYVHFPTMSSIDNGLKYDEMILCKCSVVSLCEHHFVPFIGTCHVAYIPASKVVGLSKLNRVVDFFSRRPQIQERLTLQIHAALAFCLETEDVATVMSCEHMCVKLRGIKDQNSRTTTSKLSGRFMSVPALRAEFLALTK
jgi:GTP cyclohydrolase I